MQPQYPQYPAQPTYPQYPPQAPAYPPQAPAYPPQGPVGEWPPAPQYAPPAPPPTVAGTLDDFFDQPSTGSKSWVFMNRPIGTTYAGIVARAVTKADVRQQTDKGGKGSFYRDGRPKFVMVVPMLVTPNAEYPEGQASWWVKGQARDELLRAMAEAGAPEGPPEAGAAIMVKLIGMRPVPGFNPQYQYRVHYVRPQGASPAPQPQQSAPPAVNPWPAPDYNAALAQQWPQQNPGPPLAPQPAYVPGMEGQPIPALNIGPTVTPPVPPQVPVAPAQLPAAAPPAQVPNNLTPEQQALLNKLTGG